MPTLQVIDGNKPKGYALVYGLRLYADADVQRVEGGTVIQADGRESRVTLHLLEGSREQIRARLLESIDAFFDIFGEDERATPPSPRLVSVSTSRDDEPGC